MSHVIYIATVILVIATLVPLSRHTHWLIRGLDFPRMQLACFAMLLLVLQCVELDAADEYRWLAVTATALCLAWQLWWILPYTRLWRSEVSSSQHADGDSQLCILTANVLTPNRQAHKLIALVNEHQPDVLVTLESDLWWQNQLADLETQMPYTIQCPLDNLYGMHVYSRLPLTDCQTRFLVEEDVPSMHALLQLANGEQVRVHFLHPAPPSPTENPESAQRDAELVIVAKSLAHSEQPIIVTGDLNDVAWSRTTRLFRKISGLLDPRVGRGMFNTFHVDFPFLRWPLDHLFHSDHFTVNSIARLPSIGSDHFPLLTHLTFVNSRGTAQQGLQADEEDKAFADSLEDAQRVSSTDVPEPGK